MQTPPEYRHPSRWIRFSKYLIPAEALLPSKSYERAPARRIGIQDYQRERPEDLSLEWLENNHGIAPYTLVQYIDGERCECVLPSPEPESMYIGRLKNGASYGRHCTVITPRGEVLEESGYHRDPDPKRDSRHAGWRKFTLKYYRHRWLSDPTFRFLMPQRQWLDARVAALSLRCCNNFYHWLLEVLPRLAMMIQAGVSADYYLIECQSGYQKKLLALLGIPASKLIQPHCRQLLQARELIVPAFPCPEALRTLGRLIASARGSKPPALAAGGRRLFISRRRTTRRRLQNEDQVEALLCRRGFEVHCFEDYDIHRQMQLMGEASFIVSTHGAGLSNLLFANPNAKVIEFAPYDRSNFLLYPTLSQTLGISHWQLVSLPVARHQALCPSLEDLRRALDEAETEASKQVA